MVGTIVDVFATPSCFTTLPVRVHEHEKDIARCEDTILGVFRDLSLRIKIRPHSKGPNGNFFAFCYPDGLTDRVSLNAEIIEALWIYDDIIETLPQSEAAKLHGSFCALLDRPDVPLMNNDSSILEMFRGVAPKLLALDPQTGRFVIDALKTYLREHDSSEHSFGSFDQYINFRHVNVGFDIMEAFMRWNHDIQLSASEDAASQAYRKAAGAAMALTNDYFSWQAEKADSASRGQNAVAIAMDLYSLGEDHARALVKGLVMDAEEKTRRLGVELARGGSSEMERYVKAMGFMLGGHLFWSASCPRYNSTI